MKLLAAVCGGAAVIILGMLGASDAAPATYMASSKMNVGQTSVESAPPTTPIISMAVPSIKGPAPLPSEEQAAE